MEVWPSSVVLRALNRPLVRWLKTVVLSEREKAPADIETCAFWMAWEKPDENLAGRRDLPDGKQCQRDRTRPNPVDFGDLASTNGFKLYPRRIPKGVTIVLDVSEGTPLNAKALIIGMATGQNVRECALEPAPVIPTITD
ncbi:hypothetical protein [Actinomadura sp. 6N118]|uniref:hypothetical protein n=1 Tax=Actinomadura sp. 6N118 TaxID=3375151 RepID=UPI00378E7E51